MLPAMWAMPPCMNIEVKMVTQNGGCSGGCCADSTGGPRARRSRIGPRRHDLRRGQRLRLLRADAAARGVGGAERRAQDQLHRAGAGRERRVKRYSVKIPAGVDAGTYDGHLEAMRVRRLYFRDHGAVSSDHGTQTANTYEVSDVPHVMYINYEAEALHGAYWHNNFGQKMSHGCVNQPLDVAAFMFDFAPLGTPVNVYA